MKIVFLDRSTLPSQIELRKPNFKHEWQDYESTDASDVVTRLANAEIAIVNKVKITRSVLEATPKLQLIAVSATGTDNIDLQACQDHDVLVCNIRNYSRYSVPEHTFALIFALRRSIFAYRDAVKAGRWQQTGQFCFFDYPIRDLANSTLGIIGDGVLGQAVAVLGRALGMHVIFAGHKGRIGQGSLYTTFEETLRISDVITLHCPLNEMTRNMIGKDEFAAMKRQPLLINTARGGLVDETAVDAALNLGQISGAAFDVVTVEPPSVAHPFMALASRPDFILTPHIAWASEEAAQTLADQLISNLEAFVQAEPKNIVKV
jgi:glycerate dehydrogenase